MATARTGLSSLDAEFAATSNEPGQTAEVKSEPRSGDEVPAGAQSAQASGDNAARDAEAAAEIKKLEDYLNWKHNAPLLYDTLLPHHCQWPALALQWGPFAFPKSLPIDDYGRKYFNYQTLYFSRQTNGVYNSEACVWQGATLRARSILDIDCRLHV